jgi:hypothetical protein
MKDGVVNGHCSSRLVVPPGSCSVNSCHSTFHISHFLTGEGGKFHVGRKVDNSFNTKGQRVKGLTRLIFLDPLTL